MRYYVLMGVSGCGKSSLGSALSALCDIDFVEGDDLHPQANIAKMARGEPLADADRAPWLADVGRTLAQAPATMVISCSALKKKYRDWIRDQVPEPVHFLHLDAPQDVLVARVAARAGHFMPTKLLDSQYAALERLQSGELGIEIDISQPLTGVIEQAENYIKETML